MNSLINVCGKEIRVTGHLVRTARLEADKYQFLDDPQAMIEGLRRCGTRIDLFTFMQKLPETSRKYDYPMELDNFAALPITTFDEWWTKELGFKARNKAKQAGKKGAIIREVPFDEALAKGIWEIYNESPVRQGRRFPHFGKDLATIYRELGTFRENGVFIGAYVGESLIGFTKIVFDETRTQAGLMNIVSMIRHRDKAPTNALIAHAVRSCAERGVRYLVYSNFAYGNKQHDSLSEFKERNGFRRIDLPRYYVPLTHLGGIAFRLELHHNIADYVPESVGNKLREFRKAWYARRFREATEA